MKDELEQFTGYDVADDVLDTDDFQNAGTDIKINPDFYIHLSLIQLNRALVKDNLQDGLLQYTLTVEHIQRLAVASKIVDDNEDSTFSKEIKKFIVDNKLDRSKTTDMMKIAQFKLQKIMNSVFSTRTNTAPLKLGNKKKEDEKATI